MPPTTNHREQTRACQLREMGAGRLRRDSRRNGKLAGGQGTAIEKCPHHRGPRRVSDQRRDLRDDGACDHFRYVTPEWAENTSTVIEAAHRGRQTQRRRLLIARSLGGHDSQKRQLRLRAEAHRRTPRPRPCTDVDPQASAA